MKTIQKTTFQNQKPKSKNKPPENRKHLAVTQPQGEFQKHRSITHNKGTRTI